MKMGGKHNCLKNSRQKIKRTKNKPDSDGSVEGERADARRDGRTRLARSNPEAQMGTGKNHVFCSVDHEQDWRSHPVDPYSAERADHTYISTYIQYIPCSKCIMKKIGRCLVHKCTSMSLYHHVFWGFLKIDVP